MERISRIDLFYEVARLVSQRSTCLRAKVGVVAIRDNRIISYGYNGALPNEEHCVADTCNDGAPCENTVHAEANLIAFCAKKGIALEGCTLYLTHQPCKDCSELIIQSGITAVHYLKEYRDPSGINLLKRAGLGVFKGDEKYTKILR